MAYGKTIPMWLTSFNLSQLLRFKSSNNNILNICLKEILC